MRLLMRRLTCFVTLEQGKGGRNIKRRRKRSAME